MRQSVKIACWAIVAFGAMVFTLLVNNLMKPAPWTAAAVIAVLPALILAGLLTVNDKLRRQGLSDPQIPTGKGNLGRSLFKASLFGLAAGVAGTVVLYLL
jgi:hypothetical protein